MTVVTVIYHTHQNVYTKKIGHIFCIYVLTSMRTDIERIIINAPLKENRSLIGSSDL